MTDLSFRLKQAREALEHSQQSMSDALEIGLRSWQYYEAGKKVPGSPVIEGLSRLGINANWLLTGSGPIWLELESEVLQEYESAQGYLASIMKMVAGMPEETQRVILSLCEEKLAALRDKQQLEELKETIDKLVNKAD